MQLTSSTHGLSLFHEHSAALGDRVVVEVDVVDVVDVVVLGVAVVVVGAVCKYK